MTVFFYFVRDVLALDFAVLYSTFSLECPSEIDICYYTFYHTHECIFVYIVNQTYRVCVI